MGTGQFGGPLGIGGVSAGSIGSTQLANDAVTNAKLRNSAALSVIGRSANSTGDPADIAAVAASGAVLREASNVVGFGTIATAGLADAAVTSAKLRDSGGLSVIGRSANGAGVPADIAADNGAGGVLREAGGVLGFGTVAAAGIGTAAVTNAKLRDSAGVSVIGRSANSTGVPADIAAGSNLQYFGRRANALGFFALNEDDIGWVISRQTLGADAQDVSFTVDGNVDEVVEIEVYGLVAISTLSIVYNDGSTTVQSNVANTSRAAGTITAGTTMPVNDGPLGLRLVFFLKLIDAQERVGFGKIVSADNTGAGQNLMDLSWSWPNTTDNVTTIILRSSSATGFKSDVQAICRRRKLSA